MLISTFSSRSRHLISSLARPGVEAGGHVVLLLGAELLEGVGADVVVGHHQPVGRDERARAAAVEPTDDRCRCASHACVRLEAVLLPEESLGGLLNSHMPSSPRTPTRAASTSSKNPQRRQNLPRQLRASFSSSSSSRKQIIVAGRGRWKECPPATRVWQVFLAGTSNDIPTRKRQRGFSRRPSLALRVGMRLPGKLARPG